MARGTWLLIIGLALLVGGLGWAVVAVTQLAPTDRGDASGFGQFVLAAVGLVLTAWSILEPRLRRGKSDIGADELVDRLAVAVHAQWTDAAAQRGLRAPAPLPIRWRRCADQVAGPVAAATMPRSPGESFPPLPGLAPVTSSQLRQGTYRMLHRIYGGLASGRLILAGGPGTGKSSAAILLLLDALRHRDQTPPDDRARVPVPVLFTLGGWDPATTNVHDWLVGKLTELPTLNSRERATQLLAAGRIAVLLDGLDEIPEPQRPVALCALAQQADFRLVLLTRTTELATAAREHIPTGAAALELQPLAATDAATYLRDGLLDPPPEPWQQLLTTLTTEPAAPITEALNNPLTISLLRDTYQSVATPVSELLDTARFATAEDITNHLLDHAITTAYTPKPGHPAPRYTARIAQHTLTFIAQHLRDHNTRDLAWWDIPSWIPYAPRSLVTVALDATVSGFAGGLAGWLAGSVVGGFAGGAVFGAVFGFMTAHLTTRGHAEPSHLAPPRRDGVRWGGVFLFALLAALVFGSMFGFVFGLEGGLLGGLAVALVAGLAFWLMSGLESDDLSKAAHPKGLWRADLILCLAFGLAFGLVFGIIFGIVGGTLLGPVPGLGFGLVAALVVMPAIGLMASAAWHMAISQIYLTIRYRMPFRLGRFLVDAHARHLMRTVGPIYQFRHATLQDRLAPPAQSPLKTEASLADDVR